MNQLHVLLDLTARYWANDPYRLEDNHVEPFGIRLPALLSRTSTWIDCLPASRLAVMEVSDETHR